MLNGSATSLVGAIVLGQATTHGDLHESSLLFRRRNPFHRWTAKAIRSSVHSFQPTPLFLGRTIAQVLFLTAPVAHTRLTQIGGSASDRIEIHVLVLVQRCDQSAYLAA